MGGKAPPIHPPPTNRTHRINPKPADVHARMIELGWDKRPGVTILFGRWQDVLPQLLERKFDGIFFDTYGEIEKSDLHGRLGQWCEATSHLQPQQPIL
jgi:hypothetical protein